MLRCVMNEENHESNGDVNPYAQIFVRQAPGKASRLLRSAIHVVIDVGTAA
jgi:hypothetical protein